MPCYLFTLHAYGTWMPDRKRGFVHRDTGLQPSNEKLAAAYRRAQTETTVTFDELARRTVIAAANEATSALGARLHFVATDPTHAHLLISWKTNHDWKHVRRSLRSSVTRHLNRVGGPRTWLAKTGSRRRIRDREHFDYLVQKYLPDHRGVCWRENDAKSVE